MLSSVLRSERAVKVNIATNEQLRRKIEEMEKRYDAKFQIVFSAIKRMLEAPRPAQHAIGFHAAKERKVKSGPPSSSRINNNSALRG